MSTTTQIPSTSPINQGIIGANKLALRRVVQDLCRKDFLVFQRVELNLEVANHHKEWWEHLKTGEDCSFMSPRDHGKSHSLARAYPIWKLKYDDWVKEVYILGADQPSAVENLDKIKELMASSNSLRPLLPETRSEGMNSRTEIRLMNGKFLKAKGYFSPLRGRHPQLIVLDDVENEKNSMNEQSRVRVKKYFWDAVMPMKDKGTLSQRNRGYRAQVVVIGTPQDREDLYFDLQKARGFRSLKHQAIIDFEKQRVLWPERYSYDDLINIKEQRGPLSFSKEYQCEPLSDEISIFPTTLFDQPGVKDENLSYVPYYEGNNLTFLGADFSVPGSSDGDWTVVFVWEYDLTKKVYKILTFWRAQPDTIQEQIMKVEHFCAAYKITAGYVEDNMFQKIYANHFRQNTKLPIQGHTVTNTGKNSFETGIISFRPLLEASKIIFPYKNQRDKIMTEHLIKEFNGITKRNGKIGNTSFHDDAILSMWHCLCCSRLSTSFSYDIS